MKKIIFACILLPATLALQSCFFSEDDVFDEAPTDRTEAAIEQYKSLLKAAPNGWKLEYFPGGESHNIGGATLLMKFDGDNVTMISDQDVTQFGSTETTNAGTRVASGYTLNYAQGPVLSFNTYNVLLHYYCEPRGGLDADGFEGDYEFVITEADENQFTLRGKKHGTKMHLTRLDESVDWDEYIAGCVRTYNESEIYSTLVGYDGGTVFEKGFLLQQNVLNYGTGFSQQVSVAYTNRGIRLYEPTTINGVTCDEFVWDNNTRTFHSTTGNVSLKYERPDYYLPIEAYTDGEWEMYYKYDFGRNDTTVTTTFTRMEETDTLLTYLNVIGYNYEAKAIYNRATGMIEFRSQFIRRVTLQTNTGEQLNAYIHLCPWDSYDTNVLMLDMAGIVSQATQINPHVMRFANNRRTSYNLDLDGFVMMAFEGADRASNMLGALRTYGEIELRQIINEEEGEAE